jgi:hypothetical protein
VKGGRHVGPKGVKRKRNKKEVPSFYGNENAGKRKEKKLKRL